MKHRQNDLGEKKTKAKKIGLKEEELNEIRLFEIAKQTKKNVSSFAQLLGQEAKAIILTSDWRDIQSFIAEIKRECERLFAESPEIKEQQDKHNKRTQLVRLKNDCETQHQNFIKKEKELQDFERNLDNLNSNFFMKEDVCPVWSSFVNDQIKKAIKNATYKEKLKEFNAWNPDEAVKREFSVLKDKKDKEEYITDALDIWFDQSYNDAPSTKWRC